MIEHNREGVEKVADTLVERRELHGDEIVNLLDSVQLGIPVKENGFHVRAKSRRRSAGSTAEPTASRSSL